MTGFMRNPETIWVRPPFPTIFPPLPPHPLPPHQLGHDWVHEEPRFALGSRRTQSRFGFVTNPSLLCFGFNTNLGQIWVRREPRADLGSSRTQVCSALGSTRTQVCSGFVANPGLLCSGFDANPGLLWVCHEPRSALGSARTQISFRKMYANSLIHGDSHMLFAEDRNKVLVEVSWEIAVSLSQQCKSSPFLKVRLIPREPRLLGSLRTRELDSLQTQAPGFVGNPRARFLVNPSAWVHHELASWVRCQPTLLGSLRTHELVSALNSIFQQWDIRAPPNSWNISGEPCTGTALSQDASDSPYITCNCSFDNATTCHITKLGVASLNVRGVMPEELLAFKFLTYLNLGKNYITGTLPAWIGNLSTLQYLSVIVNAFSGPIPKELGNLKELTYL
ncbi:hypothetical protein SLEP1_g57491 [Rubroshorea leprosula]|uniref:LRR receptor-like serine/threonine-protein kinase n=1 Tax=Rubroshorea leprosula TaxID=152421 RepID=A0AAV5MQE0_9ROSI|nr:hypothetical protein SLEP1_g57491 [Rubroshorea leprosula]